MCRCGKDDPYFSTLLDKKPGKNCRLVSRNSTTNSQNDLLAAKLVQAADFIAQMRWSNQFWRAFDWLMLMLVLFHSFVGMRTVVIDYVRGGWRTLVLSALYLLAFGLFVIGTLVVLTLPAARVVPA